METNNTRIVVVTGSASGHFVDSKLLLASWWDHNRDLTFVYCDFGLTADERQEIARWPIILRERPPHLAGANPFRCKSALIDFLRGVDWTHLVWIDADAMFLRPLPSVSTALAGYDVLVDPHRMSIGEVTDDALIEALRLERTDCYFSAGFWMTSTSAWLERYRDLAEAVMPLSGMWENDAFVAAIYESRLRVRPVSGNIWHARVNTSAKTCQLVNGSLCHGETPIYVLHANNGYTTRADGRRVFTRDILRDIQDRYEARYEEISRQWMRSEPAAPISSDGGLVTTAAGQSAATS